MTESCGIKLSKIWLNDRALQLPLSWFFFGERDEKSLNADSMEAFIHKHHILMCLYRTQAYVHYFFLSFINTFYLNQSTVNDTILKWRWHDTKVMGYVTFQDLFVNNELTECWVVIVSHLVNVDIFRCLTSFNLLLYLKVFYTNNTNYRMVLLLLLLLTYHLLYDRKCCAFRWHFFKTN